MLNINCISAGTLQLYVLC